MSALGRIASRFSRWRRRNCFRGRERNVPLEVPSSGSDGHRKSIGPLSCSRQSTSTESIMDVVESGVVIELDLCRANSQPFLLMMSTDSMPRSYAPYMKGAFLATFGDPRISVQHCVPCGVTSALADEDILGRPARRFLALSLAVWLTICLCMRWDCRSHRTLLAQMANWMLTFERGSIWNVARSLAYHPAWTF